jgi:hypothetical protein
VRTARQLLSRIGSVIVSANGPGRASALKTQMSPPAVTLSSRYVADLSAPGTSSGACTVSPRPASSSSPQGGIARRCSGPTGRARPRRCDHVPRPSAPAAVASGQQTPVSLCAEGLIALISRRQDVGCSGRRYRADARLALSRRAARSGPASEPSLSANASARYAVPNIPGVGPVAWVRGAAWLDWEPVAARGR